MEIGIWPVVGIVFFILRISKLINWPWKWVFAPFWIPIVGAVVFWILFIGVIAITSI